MNEAETIDACILPALKAAGWNAEGCRIRREYRITEGRIEGRGRRGKALKADIVLEYRNTKLAVVEAKAEDKELNEGAGQAEESGQTFAGFQKYLYTEVEAEPEIASPSLP